MKTLVKFRKYILWLSVPMLIGFTLMGMSLNRKDGDIKIDDYLEECTNEGCNKEEVKELYLSYKEECCGEFQCSAEEVRELGGNTQATAQMKEKWRQYGYNTVCPTSNCSHVATSTSCYFLVLVCHDKWSCPGQGIITNSYACGGCFGAWSDKPQQ